MIPIGNATPIEDLCLSVRSEWCLRLAGIKTAGEIRQFTDHQLLRLPNFGRKSLREVRDATGPSDPLLSGLRILVRGHGYLAVLRALESMRDRP